MAKYVLNPSHGPAVYDLIAVANHYGGMGGGHCKYFILNWTLTFILPFFIRMDWFKLLYVSDTAYGKNNGTGSWYYFDDSSVTQSAESNVIVSIT